MCLPKGFGSNFLPGAAKGEAAGLLPASAKGLAAGGLGLEAFAKGLAGGLAGLAAAKGLAGAAGLLAAANGVAIWSFGLLSSEKRSAGGGGSLLPASLVCELVFLASGADLYNTLVRLDVLVVD